MNRKLTGYKGLSLTKINHLERQIEASEFGESSMLHVFWLHPIYRKQNLNQQTFCTITEYDRFSHARHKRNLAVQFSLSIFA